MVRNSFQKKHILLLLTWMQIFLRVQEMILKNALFVQSGIEVERQTDQVYVGVDRQHMQDLADFCLS